MHGAKTVAVALMISLISIAIGWELAIRADVMLSRDIYEGSLSSLAGSSAMYEVDRYDPVRCVDHEIRGRAKVREDPAWRHLLASDEVGAAARANSQYKLAVSGSAERLSAIIFNKGFLADPKVFTGGSLNERVALILGADHPCTQRAGVK